MTRRHLAATVVLAFSGALTLAAPQVFRSVAQGVVVDVSVRRAGRPVPGLTTADFELRDNGVRQAIIDAAPEVLPLDVRLTIDVSGSVTPAQRDRLVAAIGRVAAALGPDDRCALLAFAIRISERSPLGDCRSLRTLDPAKLTHDAPNGTAIFDAAAVTLLAPESPGRRRLGVVLTDSLENASVTDAASLIELAKRSDMIVDVIIDAGRQALPTTGEHWNALATLAETTGGRLVRLDARGDPGDAFLAALDELRTSYLLRYSPAGVAATGWHDIGVKITSRSGYDVRARKGYFSGK